MTNVNVFWIFMLDYSKNWGIHRHSHDYYQLYYITSGKGIMEIEQQRITLFPGRSVLILPGLEHELFEIQEGVLRMIDVKFYIQDDLLSNELGKIPCTLQMEEEFYTLLSRVRTEWKSALPFKKNMANILLEQCLYSLVRTFVKSEDSKFLFPQLHEKMERLDGLSRQIADYVQQHFCEGLSLDRMAKELTYNRNYLCKVFKQATDMTIVHYANYLRISKAVDMIRYTNEKMSDICESSGFRDIHYFSKVFKQITGHTPGELRNRQEYDMYTDILQHGRFVYRYYNGLNTDAESSKAGEPD